MMMPSLKCPIGSLLGLVAAGQRAAQLTAPRIERHRSVSPRHECRRAVSIRFKYVPFNSSASLTTRTSVTSRWPTFFVRRDDVLVVGKTRFYGRPSREPNAQAACRLSVNDENFRLDRPWPDRPVACRSSRWPRHVELQRGRMRQQVLEPASGRRHPCESGRPQSADPPQAEPRPVRGRTRIDATIHRIGQLLHVDRCAK